MKTIIIAVAESGYTKISANGAPLTVATNVNKSNVNYKSGCLSFEIYADDIDIQIKDDAVIATLELVSDYDFRLIIPNDYVIQYG